MELSLKEASNLVDVVGWFTAGLWLFRIFWRRENFAKIDLTVSACVMAVNEDSKIFEVRVDVKNTSQVRHIIKEMTYDASGVSLSCTERREADALELDFPVEIARSRRLFPESWEYSFVEFGCTSTYRQCIVIPSCISLVKIDARMQYSESVSDFHSAAWFGRI